MKEVKGYVESSLMERFGECKIDFLTLSLTQGPGFEIYVTLSPIGQGEPDYEAMWGELKRIYSGHKGVSWDMHKIKAEYTPKPETRPDEGTKPEGKETCPVCGGDGKTRNPVSLVGCGRCGGTGLVDKTDVSTEKPEGE